MKRFFAWVSAHAGQAYIKLFPNTLKKRTWWPVFVVGVVLIAAMSVGIAHAQISFSLDGLLNGLAELIASILIELAKLCIFLTIFFLRAFITLASYNNFIDVSVVKLGWVMVRDVANMFFIVGLLVIAFATILGFESYEWKHGLVKIVLMAILINFSNLIAQLVIDVAHIFTITFLNAVSATAGGNLITLFQMDKILALASGAPDALGETRQVASLTLFAGSVLAFAFALLAALTIGAYLVVMVFRIVMLWALIVLSPLAFMLYAVPKGEEYAHEWWSEFSKHVIVAPIMVFFLWLAFATLGTGQIITEIQKDPNVIQLDSSGEEKQTVTVLEISTWENFASFLLAIGFLWVGIKKTEETGATGAGLVGNAIDFTKNVATIATGYAAGRWLVGGAVEKTKELGGTYTKLGMGALGDTKTGKFAKKWSGYDRLKRGSINREEALAALERKKDAYKAQIRAEVARKPEGLAGWLSPNQQKIAKQEALTERAERELHAAEAGAKAQATEDLARKEPDRLQKVREEEATAHGIEHALDNEEKNFAATIKLEHTGHEKEKYDKNVEENTKQRTAKLGWDDEDRKQDREIDAIKDEKKQKIAREEFDERLKKEGKGQKTAALMREVQLESAKDLPHIYAGLLENQTKLTERQTKGIENQAVGFSNLKLIQTERDEVASAIYEAERNAIEQRALEIAAINNVAAQMEAAKLAGKPISETDAEERRRKLKEEYLNEKDAEKRDELIRLNKEQAVKEFSDQDRMKVAEQVILENSFDKNNHKFKDSRWMTVFAEYANASAEMKIKKGETETKRIGFRVSDVLRGTEGKLIDEEKNFQRAKAAEAFKEISELMPEQIYDTIAEKHTFIKKMKDKLDTDGTLSDPEQKALEQASQTMTQYVAAAEYKGYHGGLVSLIKSLDSSFKGVVDNDENVGKLLMGLLSGRSFEKVNNEEGFLEAQQELKKLNKEKHPELSRALHIGTNESAEKYGNIHLKGRIREGVDDIGNDQIAFADYMDSGLGAVVKGKKKKYMKYGTGKSEILTGDKIPKNGLQLALQDKKDYVLPGHKIKGVGDGRAFTDRFEDADGVMHSEMKKEAIPLITTTYSTMNPGDILAGTNEGSAKLKQLMGAHSYNGMTTRKVLNDKGEVVLGADGKEKEEEVSEIFDAANKQFGLYDKKNNRYNKVHKSFIDAWSPLIKEYYNQVTSGQESVQQNGLARWRNMYQGLGVEGAEKMSADELLEIADRSGLVT